jgi:hypothetical protein
MPSRIATRDLRNTQPSDPRIVEVAPWQNAPLSAANDTSVMHRDAVTVGSSSGQSTIDRRTTIAAILACPALFAAGLTAGRAFYLSAWDLPGSRCQAFGTARLGIHTMSID